MKFTIGMFQGPQGKIRDHYPLIKGLESKFPGKFYFESAPTNTSIVPELFWEIEAIEGNMTPAVLLTIITAVCWGYELAIEN